MEAVVQKKISQRVRRKAREVQLYALAYFIAYGLRQNITDPCCVYASDVEIANSAVCVSVAKHTMAQCRYLNRSQGGRDGKRQYHDIGAQD